MRVFSRAGMGPCMGQQCGNAISRIMTTETGLDVPKIGYFSVRTPLKPMSLAELASLDDTDP
ncbi:hypothetical protein [Pseudopelagicola sp. nBUS_19]|uniref:hypothetical protein n=1 Tax=Pseudopelagicola sp. nBUS_19 TaxID=3395316 RepID=UPI003EB6BB89